LYFDLSLVLVAYFASGFFMMSSKTADLSVYPTLLSLFGIILLFRLTTTGSIARLAVVSSYFLLIPAFFVAAEAIRPEILHKLYFSLPEHQFLKNLRIPENAYTLGIENLREILESERSNADTLMVVPDDPALVGWMDMPRPKRFICANHFVDTFPAAILPHELSVLKRMKPTWIMYVNREKWRQWYRQFVTSGSASETFITWVEENLLNTGEYTLREKVMVSTGLYVELWKQKPPVFRYKNPDLEDREDNSASKI